MQPLSRRWFVIRTAAAVGATALAGRALRPSTWAAAVGANDAIRIGVIGLGGKGTQHMITAVPCSRLPWLQVIAAA
jgi:hypothetical protein